MALSSNCLPHLRNGAVHEGCPHASSALYLPADRSENVKAAVLTEVLFVFQRLPIKTRRWSPLADMLLWGTKNVYSSAARFFSPPIRGEVLMSETLAAVWFLSPRLIVLSFSSHFFRINWRPSREATSMLMMKLCGCRGELAPTHTHS